MAADTATLSLRLADEAATSRLAEVLARMLVPGITIHLSGDLGSGKTALTRGLLRHLGHTGRVRSPTFTLVEPYNLSGFNLYHFDFYRLSDKRAWLDAGFDEYLDGRSVVVIEWPEQAGDTLPPPDLSICLRREPDAADEVRWADLSARGPWGLTCLKAIRDAGC
jgi:tRNA threonylcarbamoyladenosine biosynthesis protein TsaE